MMPHTPHNPPARLVEHYQAQTDSPFMARYWAMCEWFDETVGELLQHLADRGVKDDTVVVYLHDNGWIQDPAKEGFAPKSKRSPYQGGVQTPIVIRWPNHVQPARCETPVSSLDLVPTVLIAVGERPSEEMLGIDLLNVDAAQRHGPVFGEIFEHNAIDIHVPAKNLQYRWLRDGRWKLIVPNPARVPLGEIELYDLEHDPQEHENLAKRHPEKVDALHRRMDDIWSGQ